MPADPLARLAVALLAGAVVACLTVGAGCALWLVGRPVARHLRRAFSDSAWRAHVKAMARREGLPAVLPVSDERRERLFGTIDRTRN